MSERKVLSKYYPPDFDPSALGRQRAPKQTGPKLQPVRLMAPFSMKCTSCAEYIYKGRKFNARKETTDEKYYNIPIYRFYIKCTRCASEITFRTDPKHMDYECEKGARRNFEPWRESKLAEETEEERLDRLEREEAERDAMAELENKTLDAKTEMAIADALDNIRTRNARLEKAQAEGGGEALVSEDPLAKEKERLDKEDEAAARAAFAKYQEELFEDTEIPAEEVKEENTDNAWQPKKKPTKSTTTAILSKVKVASQAQDVKSASSAPPKRTETKSTGPVPVKTVSLGLGSYDSDSD
jgi:hypothetical protein